MEVLDEIGDRHRPASQALADWGRAHRFAGGRDRAAIGNLVFDVLRHKASLSSRTGSEAARGLVLAAAHTLWGLDVDEIAEACRSTYGPGALGDEERRSLAAPAADAPDWVKGDCPEWLAPALARAFGDRAVAEATGLARRAPVDLRANTLKASRDKVLSALGKFGAEAGPLSPLAVRIPPPDADGRTPNVEAEPAHAHGWFEVQDSGSQVAALMTAARSGMQVADICAGAGGKTLALAAMMQNKGQIHAHDADRHRLRPIFERLKRAGARNVQVIPADGAEHLDALQRRMDVVLVDAPCSGTGAWRRRPDAKWRLTPAAVDERLAEQRAVLERACPLVKPGGRLVYVTCSVLPQENGEQVQAFLAAHPGFALVPYAGVWCEALPGDVPQSADGSEETLLLTPASHSTDGFFIAVMRHDGG